jgi:hypothetical protein
MNTDVALSATYAELPAIVKVTAAGTAGKAGPQGPVGLAGPPMPPPELRPPDCGLVAWTFNPQRYSVYCSYVAASVVGKLLLWAFASGVGGSVSLLRCCGVAGAGMSNSYVGIYDANGNLVASSPTDLSSQLMVTSVITATLSAPYVLKPSALYRVGLVVGAATTYPSLTGYPNGTPANANMGMPASKYASAMYGSGLTALPASHGALSPNGGGVVWVMA